MVNKHPYHRTPHRCPICPHDGVEHTQTHAVNHLVLIRHGQSLYNQRGLFTGWADVGLSDLGATQARKAGEYLREMNLDLIYTSDLSRAIRTAQIVLAAASSLPGSGPRLVSTPTLRGRNDGDLVGRDILEAARSYGNEKAPLWRRSYDLKLPGGESLADVVRRVDGFLNTEIMPVLEKGKSVGVVTHGNTIRAILVLLGVCPPQTATNVEVANGSVWAWHYCADGQVTKEVLFNG